MKYKLVIQYYSDKFTEVLAEGCRSEMKDCFERLCKIHCHQRYYDEGGEGSDAPWVAFKQLGKYYERVKVWLCDEIVADKIVDLQNSFNGHIQ